MTTQPIELSEKVIDAYVNTPDVGMDRLRVGIQADRIEQAERRCVWTREKNPDDDRGYDCSCGQSILMTDGTPQENDYKFCPFCGLRIEVKET